MVNLNLSHFPKGYNIIKRFYSGSRNTVYKDLIRICETRVLPKKFNFSRDVFDRHAATDPNRLALWFDNDLQEDRKWTFSELQVESIKSSLFLRSLLDLPNSTEPLGTNSTNKVPFIFTLLSRVPEWWFLHLAAIRVGSIFSPGTKMLTVKDIEYRLDSSHARMIITDVETVGKVDEACEALKGRDCIKNLKKVVVTDPRRVVGNGWINFNEAKATFTAKEVLAFKNTDTRSEDVAQAFFTSGTTGPPKMVAHSHVSYGIGHCTTVDLLNLRETDVMWNISDPGWAKSSYSCFYAPWIAGCTVYIHQMEKFEAKKVLKVLCERPITNLCAPPTLYKSMVQITDEFKTKSLRFSIGAGEAVDPITAQVWKDKTGCVLVEGYGQTEMCAIDAKPTEKPGSIGIPNGLYDLRVVDKNVNELPPNSEGQIALKVKPNRPVGLFEGYLTKGENGPQMDTVKNDKVFIGDYYLTGDRAFKDESGHLFHLGRNDDVINSAGYRIGPYEVESVLQGHPAVAESAAVPSPDLNRGEVVKAFIILTDEYENQDKEKLIREIQEYFKKTTAPYKYPRRIEFVKSLPKTVSGKILRRELKKAEFENAKSS